LHHARTILGAGFVDIETAVLAVRVVSDDGVQFQQRNAQRAARAGTSHPDDLVNVASPDELKVPAGHV
jgi:hypothetical protein